MDDINLEIQINVILIYLCKTQTPIKFFPDAENLP